MGKKYNAPLGCVEIFIGVVSIIILGITLSLGIFVCGRRDMQCEAVAKGHAKWVVDVERNIDFKWLATQTMKVEKYR